MSGRDAEPGRLQQRVWLVAGTPSSFVWFRKQGNPAGEEPDLGTARSQPQSPLRRRRPSSGGAHDARSRFERFGVGASPGLVEQSGVVV